jgi:uncharacterized membrane protein
MEWVKVSYLAIEYLAVAIIAGMAGYSTIRFFIFLIAKKNTPDANYREYKHTLAAGLLLGLEILVAADVIRTVVLEPTLTNIAGLSLLVVLRTFLSWTLVIEMEHRWPWQPEHTGAISGGHSK